MANNLINSIIVDGKTIGSRAKKPYGGYKGKTPEELTQIRQLAEAQNKSIQAQTALNRAVELVIAGQIPFERCEEAAKHIYIFLQGLTQISEAEVIQSKIAKIKQETLKEGTTIIPGYTLVGDT